jgi:putative OPT family oligopeptide transporter
MPAILILGFDLEIARVMLVAVLGGMLGILMMIPLRRALIVAQHGVLKYPEGTACAEVLKAGANAESRAAASDAARAEQEAMGGAATSARTIFTGFGIGLAYKTAMSAFRAWKDVPDLGAVHGELGRWKSRRSCWGRLHHRSRVAAVMFAGGVLAYLVLIPMIAYFGGLLTVPLAPEQTALIKDMSPGAVRNAYVLYIGAGAVAAGGIISVFRSLPTIWGGLRGGLRDVSSATAATVTVTARTDRDLPIKIVLLGIVALFVALVGRVRCMVAPGCSPDWPQRR